MAPKKSAKASAVITIQDDGTLNVNVSFTDVDGLPITGLTAWPAAVALPTLAFSDATPGPSAFSYAAASAPAASTDVSNAFVVGVIGCVQPPVPGSGQGVDTTLTIASGLTNQSAPVSVDAGTLTMTADASAPGGVVVSVQN